MVLQEGEWQGRRSTYLAHSGVLESSHDKDRPKDRSRVGRASDSQIYQLAVLGSTSGACRLYLCPSLHSRRDLDINRPGTVPNAKTLR